jgi:hypothetical protein
MTTRHPLLIPAHDPRPAPPPAPGARWGVACWSILLALAVVLTQAGCAVVLLGGAAAAGAGTVAYVKGELRSTLEASLDQAWQAAQAAVQELEFAAATQEKEALAARLVARTAGDKKVEIKLKRISDTAVEARVRVGTFGDESFSHQVLERIRKHLKGGARLGRIAFGAHASG